MRTSDSLHFCAWLLVVQLLVEDVLPISTDICKTERQPSTDSRPPSLKLSPAELSLGLQVKLHPWFADLNWGSLSRNKAAFIPALENDTDVSYFLSRKPVSQPLCILRQAAGLQKGCAPCT